jgi:chloramphenicol O-acetyltransferase type A
MKIINVNNWNRKEHFDFFSKYDNPFFGIVTEIDCTHAFHESSVNNTSFFAYYMHKSITALNNVEALKYRILDGKVVSFDEIHVATTIARNDGTFGFSFVHFHSDFNTFNRELKQEIENVRNSTGLRANDDSKRIDTIHYSTLPWNKFTGLTHPRNYNTDESVPKIIFGKAFTSNDKRFLPISIDAHHGLVDGLHISQYLNEFQKLMNG